MTTYYMDTAGQNVAPYDTWVKAAVNLQTVADLAVGTDIVYCRGTQTLALNGEIDMDTNSGSTTGYIKFIGCNGAGNVDGTRFVLDANSAAANCMLAAGAIHYIWIENFEFTDATGDGFDGGDSDKWVFINCISHANGITGFDLAGMDRTKLIRCQAYGNTTGGFYAPGSTTRFVFCTAYGNGGAGWGLLGAYYELVFWGCVAHDNGDSNNGINDLGADSVVMNCVFDGTDQASEVGLKIAIIRYDQLLIGNRFTNCNVGIDFNSSPVLFGWNYFHDNTSDMSNSTNAEPIPYDSDTDTNNDDVDADDGYNDVANHDFNLKVNRDLRRTAIDLNFGS